MKIILVFVSVNFQLNHFYYSARNCIASAVLATAIPSENRDQGIEW